MAENEERKVNTQELKSEASNTVNQVRDTFKNADIKKDSIETKGFIVEMFKDPLKKIKEASEDKNGKYLKYAIIILAIWVITKFISRCFSIGLYWRTYNFFDNLVSIGIATITPIISVLVMSLIIWFMNKKNKKSFITIISTLTISNIPVVIAAVISLLTIISLKVSTITSPFTSLCSIISIILTYFGAKNIFNEEKNSEFIKKFIVIETIYYIMYVLLSFLNIYI